MTPATAESELATALEQAGLNLQALDPWEAWKVFKAFMRRGLEGGYDAACVQFAKDVTDPRQCSLFFIRQLSERDERGEDSPSWSLTLEFNYHSALFKPVEEIDVWTFDYPTLEEFASVVEGMPAFQAAVASQPRSSELSAGEL
jgi:hypothetical protein